MRLFVTLGSVPLGSDDMRPFPSPDSTERNTFQSWIVRATSGATRQKTG